MSPQGARDGSDPEFASADPTARAQIQRVKSPGQNFLSTHGAAYKLSTSKAISLQFNHTACYGGAPMSTWREAAAAA